MPVAELETDPQTIDYDALAKKAGATGSTLAPAPAVDYDALAKKAGATGQTAPDKPKEQEKPGLLKSAWDWMNRGLITKEHLVNAATGMSSEDFDKEMSPYEGETPSHAAMREFFRGSLQDTAGVGSSFTSPASVALMATGVGAGKALQAANMARAGKVAAAAGNTAAAARAAELASTTGKLINAAPKVGTAMKVAGPVAGATFAANAATEFGGARPGETDADTLQRNLQAAGGVAFGAGGALSPVAAANGPISELPGKVAAGARAVADTVGDARAARTAAKTAKAAEATKTATLAGTNEAVGVLGKEKLAKALKADAAPTLREAVNQMAADGTLKDVIGEPGQEAGATRRIHDALADQAAQHYELTKANWVNQVGNEPISIEAVRPQLEHLFGDTTTSLAEPESAAIVRKALKTGEISAGDAFPLKARLNAIAQPMHDNPVGMHDSNLATIANDVSSHLQGGIKDLIDQHLGDGQGDQFLASDQRAGRTAALRRAAAHAADRADVTNPTPSTERSVGRNVATGAGAAAGAALGSPLGVVGSAVAAPVGAALGDVVGSKFFPPEMTHPDITLANALRKIEIGPATRPEIPPEVAANLRNPGTVGPVATGRRPQAPGQNVSLPSRAEVPVTTLPDARFSREVNAGPIGARPEVANTPTAGRFADQPARAEAPNVPAAMRNADGSPSDPFFWERRKAAATADSIDHPTWSQDASGRLIRGAEGSPTTGARDFAGRVLDYMRRGLTEEEARTLASTPAEEQPLHAPEPAGSPQPTAEQTLAGRQRLGQFGTPERGVYHADEPMLDSPVAPSGSPNRIYDPAGAPQRTATPSTPPPDSRLPGAQRLGDRGAPAAQPNATLENKIAYDATRPGKLTPEGWTPPKELFKQGEETIHRFENPETKQVESWVLRDGEPVRLTARGEVSAPSEPAPQVPSALAKALEIPGVKERLRADPATAKLLDAGIENLRPGQIARLEASAKAAARPKPTGPQPAAKGVGEIASGGPAGPGAAPPQPLGQLPPPSPRAPTQGNPNAPASPILAPEVPNGPTQAPAPIQAPTAVRGPAQATSGGPPSQGQALGQLPEVPKGPAAPPQAAAVPEGMPNQPPPPGSVGKMRVQDISADPDRFQYKAGTGEAGVSNKLKDVSKYNPELAGVVSVWTDPADGKTYVVNGHHRLDLAKRTGADSVNVNSIPAANAADARSTGALQNIAEGQGTPVDAAKFFRDSGLTADDLRAKGIRLREAVAQDGMALARLDDPIFHLVSTGNLPVSRAIAIGEATADAAQQWSILKMIGEAEKRGKTVNEGTVSELARFVREAGQQTSTQESLFGAQEQTRNLAIEKAEVSSYIKDQLAKDRRLFGFVAKGGRAEELARGGNVINVGESQKISQEAAQVEELYNRLSSGVGPVSDALNHAASELANGKEPNAVKASAYKAVRDAVSEAFPGVQGPSPRGNPSLPQQPAGNSNPPGKVNGYGGTLGQLGN